jgi:phage/plasmid-associated DNA primase
MFDPQADSSMVTRFISDITSKDGVPRAEVFRYILQMFGSMLNSKRTLKKILVLWGPGTNNGKTTFLEAVKACLGSVQDNGLQGAIDPKNFDQFAQSQALTPEMCAAEKAKLITVSEAAKGIYLSCDKLKNMSGGGDISVNPKYKDSHTVVYHALIVMDCNNWPRFSDSSIFNSGRVKVIDFRWTPDHIDTGFKDKISTPENRSALLNLLISGYADFAANNYEYTEPKELQELTQSFANSNNLYRRFLVSRCAITGDNKDSIGLLQLVRSYKDWINEEGEYANNIAGCKDGLREELSVTKGIAVTTNNHNTTTVYGLRLKTPTELANSSYVNPEDIPEINRGEIEETKTPKLDEWIRFHINFKITSKASLLDIGAELEMDSKVETTDPYDASNRISTLAGNGSVFLNVGDDGDEFLTGVELVTDEVAKARRAEYIHDEVIPEIIRRTKGPYPDEVVELMFDVIKHSKDAKDEMVKVLTKYAEAHMEDYLDIKK